MAVMHHQFESIHPFYDGNGRTGRILNVLYLVAQGLLDVPVLYLSRFITKNKNDYYHLLQAKRDTGHWEAWLLYMLEGVSQTAQDTIQLILGIKHLMADYKHRIRDELPKIYSQDLLNTIFRYPYTTIKALEQSLNVQRQTAARYLGQLEQAGFLTAHKIGKQKYFINTPLYNLLLQAGCAK